MQNNTAVIAQQDALGKNLIFFFFLLKTEMSHYNECYF